MLWIAAILVAWLVVDAVVVAVMARMAAGSSPVAAAALPPLRSAATRTDNTSDPV
jgi:hypothetical protein